MMQTFHEWQLSLQEKAVVVCRLNELNVVISSLVLEMQFPNEQELMQKIIAENKQELMQKINARKKKKKELTQKINVEN